MRNFLFRTLVAGFIAMMAAKALATEIPIPTQAEWADARKTVKFANGITLAYVEMGIPTARRRS